MRRLILSSTRDVRALFLSGLLRFATGFGPLLTEALLRSDSIVVVVVTARSKGLMRALLYLHRLVTRMSRRSPSSSPPRDVKRPRLAPLTPDDYRNGLMLAPMVRSGARTSTHISVGFQSHAIFSVPTRLFALKHGAKLVWGPEMVDKAILHAERIVDRMSPLTSFMQPRS
jgi:hypothetical protein